MKNAHYYYILKCIRSCNTLIELQSCDKMIENFSNRFKDKLLDMELRTIRSYKYSKL